MLMRYLTREILGASVLVLLALLSLFFFFDLIRELDDFGRGQYRLCPTRPLALAEGAVRHAHF